jgi:hypothetical protein
MSPLTLDSFGKLCLTTYLTIENVGRRAIAISLLKLDIKIQNEEYNLESDFKSLNLIIKSGEIFNGRVELLSSQTLLFNDNRERNMKHNYFMQERNNLQCSHLEVILANGSVILSELKSLEA